MRIRVLTRFIYFSDTDIFLEIFFDEALFCCFFYIFLTSVKKKFLFSTILIKLKLHKTLIWKLDLKKVGYEEGFFLLLPSIFGESAFQKIHVNSRKKLHQNAWLFSKFLKNIPSKSTLAESYSYTPVKRCWPSSPSFCYSLTCTKILLLLLTLYKNWSWRKDVSLH